MMRVSAPLALTFCMTASACVQPALQGAGQGQPVALRVSNNGAAFGFDQGAAARTMAEGLCADQGKRLQTSIYDRFEAGAWVYPEGCA